MTSAQRVGDGEVTRHGAPARDRGAPIGPTGLDRGHTVDVTLDAAVGAARALVAERFPDARAAWLAGSVVAGTATATSDLDVTVLLDGPPAPFRESVEYAGWPVELFVHTAATVDHWLGKDRARRRPTLGRLVAGGVRLLDVDGAADPVEQACTDFLVAGPDPLAPEDRDSMRYGLSDLLDDLADATDPPIRTAVAFAVWQGAAELLLAEGGCWWGTGKWLARELASYDRAFGTRLSVRLHGGLVAAIHGEPTLLAEVAGEILDASGGRLWAGYRLGG